MIKQGHGVSPQENFETSLSFFLTLLIMSVRLLGGGWPTATRYKKVFWGVEILYRGVQPSNLPLKYSPCGRPLGILGIGDPENGGPWGWGHKPI